MLKLARKIIIVSVGSTVLLFGIILIFTPGPAIIVIPIGLAILGTEFVWARRLLRRMKAEGDKIGMMLLETIPIFGKSKNKKKPPVDTNTRES